MRKTMAGIGLAGLLLGAGAGAAGAQESSFQLNPLNESGATGTAELTLDGTSLTVSINSSGLLAGAPHAQHIHFQPGTPSQCPTMADAGDDGVLSVPEGQPSYGPIQLPLTTEGDFGADSALAVDRFPVADAQGNVTFNRTFEISQEMAGQLEGQTLAIVQHGVDLDGSGAYDGDPSPLDESVPMEATAPANCGTFTVAAASMGGGAAAGDDSDMDDSDMDDSDMDDSDMDDSDSDSGAAPSGGMATGGGGTAVDVDGGLAVGTTAALAGLAGLVAAGGGLVVARSRRNDV